MIRKCIIINLLRSYYDLILAVALIIYVLPGHETEGQRKEVTIETSIAHGPKWSKLKGPASHLHVFVLVQIFLLIFLGTEKV